MAVNSEQQTASTKAQQILSTKTVLTDSSGRSYVKLSSEDAQRVMDGNISGFYTKTAGTAYSDGEYYIDDGKPVTPSTVPFSGQKITTDMNSNTILEELNFQALQNDLNNFDQVTYHIKFSVLSDVKEINKEVIIAETGSTEINIQNFVMDAYVGPDMNTKNSSVTKMEMELLEFYGFSFMDRVIEAAYTLGVRNYQKTPFKLEVKFQGRDPTTGAAIDNVLGGKVWGWKCLISKVNTKVTEAGCVHKLDFYPISDLAGTDDYMRIPESYGATGKTCGDILTDLLGKLSDDINAKYGGIPMIKYQVGGVKYPSSAQSPVENPLLHVVTNQNVIESTRNPDNASLSTGIAINELVDILLANSATAVTLANGVGTSGAVTSGTPTKVHSTMCRIEKVIEYGNYIDLFNDYEKIVSYILVPYDTIRLVNNFDQYKNIHDAKRTSQRLQVMNSAGFMKKEYDYIFTGQNTEVLGFDIDLSFDYYNSVEIMMGVMSYTTKEQGQAYNKEADIRTQATTYMDYMTELQSLQKDDKIKPLDAQAKQREAQLQTYVNSMRPAVEAAAKASEAKDKQRIKDAIVSTNSLAQSSYADDENYSNVINDIQSIPVTLRQTPGIMASLDGVVEGHYDTRRAIYAALLDQLYGNIDSNLATVKLEIKGDPYWLGAPGYHDIFSSGFSVLGPTETVLGYEIPGQTTDSKNYANYAVGENVFVLRYKVPQGFDDTTGRPIIKENETYTGFYSVNQVTHKFTDGLYTQTISGYRIPSAEVAEVIKNGKVSSDATSTTPTTNPNPAGTTTTSQIASATNSSVNTTPATSKTT